MLILLALFFFFPLTGFAILWGLSIGPGIEIISSLLIYLLLASAYVQTYPAFQEDIPSFKILLSLKSSTSGALSEKQIVDMLADDDLLTDKIQDLVDDGLVSRTDNHLKVTRTGQLLSFFFLSYRSWLGLESGNG